MTINQKAEGSEMPLDQDVEALHQKVGQIEGRVGALEDHRDDHVDPTLRRLEESDARMQESMRNLEASLIRSTSEIKGHVSDTFVNLAGSLLEAQPGHRANQLQAQENAIAKSTDRATWIMLIIGAGGGSIVATCWGWVRAHLHF